MRQRYEIHTRCQNALRVQQRTIYSYSVSRRRAPKAETSLSEVMRELVPEEIGVALAHTASSRMDMRLACMDMKGIFDNHSFASLQ